MEVTLTIPEDLAQRFAADAAGLSRATLEALTLEGLRTGKLTIAEGRRLLGIESRYEMDGFLKAHEIFFDLTPGDVDREADIALAFKK